MIPENPDRRHAAAHSSPPGRLLVADDDASYCAYLVSVGKRLGFSVDTAADGEVALQQLARAPYDVAIIDLEMPRLTGLQVIASLRATDATTGVYTVMLTGREDIDTKLAALDAGFDDFMSKSASERELLAKLSAARRVAARQRVLDSTVRDLYGLATRDELTGVFNRRFFIAETERMLSGGANLNLIMFDLDGFKRVNDTFGHLAGDQVLHDVGALFLKSTRPEDLVARYGGDEFVMLVLDTPLHEVEHVATRLTAEIRSLRWTATDETFGISASTGVACSRLLAGPTINRLIDVADRDLYKNKWLQRNPAAQPERYTGAASPKRDRVVTLTREGEGAHRPREPRS